MTYLKNQQMKAATELNCSGYEPSELLDIGLKSFDQITLEIRRLEMAIENVHKYKNSNPKILKLLNSMLDRKRVEHRKEIILF